MKINFPNNKKFAFTIIDDTDNAFCDNIKPIYDFLNEKKIIITKTIWVYPPRDIPYSKGDSLQNIKYLDFVKDILKKGYEIGLHNVGSGDYKRPEIIKGINEFNEKLGFYPKLHVNHSYNKDNIYSGSKRFGFPLNYLVKKLYSNYSTFFGDDPNSEYFWGDLHKKHIKYARNLEIDDINTLKKIPYMPYRDKKFDEYANYWYGSTFAPNQLMFNHIVSKKSIDRLENENGVCILYTHLGYFMKKGKIDPGFIKMIDYISSKNTGWYVPVGQILDFLNERKKNQNMPDYMPFVDRKILECHSLFTRIKYRYFIKKDDFHFLNSDHYAR